MKIVSASIYALCIPFKEVFRHNLKSRSYSDSIVVRLIADTGETGYGEAVPRPYVTGETVDSCLERIENILSGLTGKSDFPGGDDISDPFVFLSEINGLIPSTGNAEIIAANAAKGAVEIALIDILLKHHGKSLGNLIPPKTGTVTYSAVITADTLEKVKKIAHDIRQYGIKQVKIKIGQGDDCSRIFSLREILGDSVSIRVDANGAFDEKGANSLIAALEPFRIDCIEQPIPRGNVAALARIKAASPIPVMVDESLVTYKDAELLIENKACDLFNLRLSKNGGCYQTLLLAECARKAGIGIQLGCLVGETAILSAAGRHVSAYLTQAKFIEGSFGTLLLENDISVKPVMFGMKGEAPLLTGPGLGIDICDDILEKYARTKIDVMK